MDASGEPRQMPTTANSRLLPLTFEPPKPRNGRLKILEPHGRRRRPKSGDFKLLAAYVAAYVGTLIPKEDYIKFIHPFGEKEWKRTLRAACDMEWRVGDVREFDDIPTQEYNVMNEYVARAWPFTKHFDGGWLVKWALRTTWTNRKKADTRNRETFRRRQQSRVTGNEDELVAPQRARRPRASKLGQSLYCIGGCQRMLDIEQFSENHVGVCKGCDDSRRLPLPVSQSRSEPLHSQGNTSTAEDQPEVCRRLDSRLPRTQESTSPAQEQPTLVLPSQEVRQRVRRRLSPELVSSSIYRRRNHHAVLPGSVTTYSDAGQYPSGRSTYGVTKPNHGGHRRRTNATLRRHTPDSQDRILPRDQATSKTIQELTSLWQNLSQNQHNSVLQDLQCRVQATNHESISPAQDTREDDVAQDTSETEDENSSTPIALYPVTAAVTKCTADICSAWGVSDIAEVFPTTLWPKPGTLWPIGVLRIFQTMAGEYQSIQQRQGICAKFAELVKTRRQKSNAKTQWSIVDARTTLAWAREQYGTPNVSDDSQESENITNTVALRSSQGRQRLTHTNTNTNTVTGTKANTQVPRPSQVLQRLDDNDTNSREANFAPRQSLLKSRVLPRAISNRGKAKCTYSQRKAQRPVKISSASELSEEAMSASSDSNG